MGLCRDLVHGGPRLHPLLPPGGPAQCPPGLTAPPLSSGIIFSLQQPGEGRALVLPEHPPAGDDAAAHTVIPPVPGADPHLLPGPLPL